MTFPEFLREKATWRTRLLCLFFGHHPVSTGRPWHPMDEAEDRRAHGLNYCARCGTEGIHRCGCGCSDV